MRMTPEQQALRRTIEQYVKPLREEMAELRERIKETEATESPAPSGQAEFELLGAKEKTVDDLSLLVKRLARALRKDNPDSELAWGALDYLKRNGLEGSPLKEST